MTIPTWPVRFRRKGVAAMFQMSVDELTAAIAEKRFPPPDHVDESGPWWALDVTLTHEIEKRYGKEAIQGVWILLRAITMEGWFDEKR